MRAIGVGFHDDAGPALADELFEVFHAINRNLPGGNEAANFIHLGFEPTFIVPGDDSFHRDAFGDIGPIADIDARTGGGELVQTVFGVEAIDGYIQFRADLRLFGQCVQRENALIAAAEIDKHVVAENAQHAPLEASFGFQNFAGRCAGFFGDDFIQRLFAQRLLQLGFQFRRERRAQVWLFDFAGRLARQFETGLSRLVFEFDRRARRRQIERLVAPRSLFF